MFSTFFGAKYCKSKVSSLSIYFSLQIYHSTNPFISSTISLLIYSSPSKPKLAFPPFFLSPKIQLIEKKTNPYDETHILLHPLAIEPCSLPFSSSMKKRKKTSLMLGYEKLSILIFPFLGGIRQFAVRSKESSDGISLFFFICILGRRGEGWRATGVQRLLSHT